MFALFLLRLRTFNPGPPTVLRQRPWPNPIKRVARTGAHLGVEIVERTNQKGNGADRLSTKLTNRRHNSAPEPGVGSSQAVCERRHGKLRLQPEIAEGSCRKVSHPRVLVTQGLYECRHSGSGVRTKPTESQGSPSPAGWSSISKRCKQWRNCVLPQVAQCTRCVCRPVGRFLISHQPHQLRKSRTALRANHFEALNGISREISGLVRVPEHPDPNRAAPDCVRKSPGKRVQFQSPRRIVVFDPLYQPRQRVCPEMIDRLPSFLPYFHGTKLGIAVNSQPLTQLFPLILRLPLPRPNHRTTTAATIPPAQPNNPSPFHTPTMPEKQPSEQFFCPPFFCQP